MKRILALLLTLGLLLAGCGGSLLPTVPTGTDVPGTETTGLPTESAVLSTTQEPATRDSATEPARTEPAPAPESSQAPAPSPESADPWSLIGVSYSDQGVYYDEMGSDFTWSYELPKLEADTPGAREINEDIDAHFGQDLRDSLKSMEDRISLGIIHIGFRSEVWDNILTLIVIEDTDWSFTNYGVYCYDCDSGTRLGTRELLQRMGYSEEDFLETCRERFIQCYKDMYSHIPEDSLDQYGYYDGLERVDDPRYVNLELQIYPEANGDLVVIAPIVSLAGADYYYQEIHLGMSASG